MFVATHDSNSRASLNGQHKLMGYSSRRLHQPALVSQEQESATICTHTHHIWTIENWINTVWFESWFLLQHQDGRVRIFHKSLDPFSLVSTVLFADPNARCRRQAWNSKPDFNTDGPESPMITFRTRLEKPNIRKQQECEKAERTQSVPNGVSDEFM